MPRLDQLSEIQRQSALYFPCLENDTAPWAPWTKELSNSKVALVSSAGLHLRNDQPFKGGDPTYRVIPFLFKIAGIILKSSPGSSVGPTFQISNGTCRTFSSLK